MIRSRLAAGLVLALGVGACGSAPASEPAVNSPGPALVVERFLQAANANDLEAMTQLFGSASKTIDQLDGRDKAERRMHLMATLLRHDDYRIIGQHAVPGRLREATELRVQLRQGTRDVIVPHLVVRRRSGGWIIEKIDLEPLTQGSRSGAAGILR